MEMFWNPMARDLSSSLTLRRVAMVLGMVIQKVRNIMMKTMARKGTMKVQSLSQLSLLAERDSVTQEQSVKLLVPEQNSSNKYHEHKSEGKVSTDSAD